MYNNKKGISDVVSTVLIILLVVAAIAIVGAIVLNIVNKGAKSVDSATACQQVELSVASCASTVAGGSNATAIRGSSGVNTRISSLNYIFYKADGSTSSNITTLGVGEFNTVGATNKSGTNTASVKAAVSPTIILSDGSSAACPATQQVACV